MHHRRRLKNKRRKNRIKKILESMDSDTLYDLLYDLLGDPRIRDHIYEAIDMIEIFGWEDDSTRDFIPKKRIQYIKWNNIQKKHQDFFNNIKNKFRNRKNDSQDP